MPIISFLFFASGFSALIYQVLWTRLVTSMIGGSDYAIAIIVTIFMAGLGLGSKFSGMLSTRFKHPGRALLLFGFFEILTGIYAVFLPLLAPKTMPVLAALYSLARDSALLYHLGALLVCAALLIFPVLLMGSTLPLLCTAILNSREKSRHGVPILYGINTLGAATGALMAGFVLIYRIGVHATTMVAAIVNIAIGITCFVLYRRVAGNAAIPLINEEEKREDEQCHSGKSRLATFALVITFVSGFVSLASEVIWTKMLGLLAGPTTFSFSVVLFSYILCLGLGSLLAVLLIRRDETLLPTLLVVQATIGGFILLVSQLLGDSGLLFAKLAFTFQQTPLLLESAKLVAVFLLFAVPVTLMGASLPMAFRIYSLHRRGIGASIGNLYAVNTLGSVLGSVSAGFILIPLIGMETTLSVVAFIQMAVALGIGYFVVEHRFARIVFLPLFLLAAVSTHRYPTWNKEHLAEGKYHRFEALGVNLGEISYLNALLNGHEMIQKRLGSTRLVYYGEGIGGFTTVMEETDILGNKRLYMANSGKVDASSHGDIYTQAMLGHLPALLHPDATNALVIGFGCGMTSGELLHYPDISIESVEISPQVVEAAALFNEWNHDALHSPRNRMIVQDARAHLLLGQGSYDIITAEPSNPWMAGLANLFTREYMSLVRSRLNENGIFIQFLHSYQIDWDTMMLMVRTIASEFPNSVLIRPAYWGSDYALVCFKNPDQRVDIENVRKNLVHAKASTLLRIEEPEVIYPLIMHENIKELAGDGPLHTDNLPVLEALAPRHMFLPGRLIDERLEQVKRLSPQTEEVLNAYTNPLIQLAFARYLASGNQPPFMVMDPSATEPELWEQFQREIHSFALANPVFDFQVVPDELVELVVAAQEPLIRARLLAISLQEHMDAFGASSCHAALASMYARLGRKDDVLASYNSMLILNPEDDNLKGNLAMMYYQKGQLDRALELIGLMKGGLDWRHVLVRAQAMVLTGETDRASRYVVSRLAASPDAELYGRYIDMLRSANQPEAVDAFMVEATKVVHFQIQ